MITSTPGTPKLQCCCADLCGPLALSLSDTQPVNNLVSSGAAAVGEMPCFSYTSLVNNEAQGHGDLHAKCKILYGRRPNCLAKTICTRRNK